MIVRAHCARMTGTVTLTQSHCAALVTLGFNSMMPQSVSVSKTTYTFTVQTLSIYVGLLVIYIRSSYILVFINNFVILSSCYVCL